MYTIWSRQDDKKLLDAFDIYQNQWSKINQETFENRSDHSILFRYNKLMQWRRLNQWLSDLPDETREFILLLFQRNRKRGYNRKRTQKNNEEKDEDESEVEDENDQDEQDTISNSVELYTKNGVLVPTRPNFVLPTNPEFLEIISEKENEVKEFIIKLRESVLDEQLLNCLGIQESYVRRIVNKFNKAQHVKKARVLKQNKADCEKSKLIREKLKEKIRNETSTPTNSNILQNDTHTKLRKKYKKRKKAEQQQHSDIDNEENLHLIQQNGNAEVGNDLIDLTSVDLTEFDADHETTYHQNNQTEPLTTLNAETLKTKRKYTKKKLNHPENTQNEDPSVSIPKASSEIQNAGKTERKKKGKNQKIAKKKVPKPKPLKISQMEQKNQPKPPKVTVKKLLKEMGAQYEAIPKLFQLETTQVLVPIQPLEQIPPVPSTSNLSIPSELTNFNLNPVVVLFRVNTNGGVQPTNSEIQLLNKANESRSAKKSTRKRMRKSDCNNNNETIDSTPANDENDEESPKQENKRTRKSRSQTAKETPVKSTEPKVKKIYQRKPKKTTPTDLNRSTLDLNNSSQNSETLNDIVVSLNTVEGK
jgi:hypothetical protein